MECTLSFLTCGQNASGHSCLLSIEKTIRSERKVINRIFLNVGDGCQRYCQEHRIKLSMISSIVITSLAPHNISGFPGIFLALSDLGLGELRVYGPVGLKAYLHFMTPFINRKYPNLLIIEVEEPLEVKLKGVKMSLLPVRSAESDKVIGCACKVNACDDQSFHFAATTSCRAISILPYAGYFSTTPSVTHAIEWACQQEDDNIISRDSNAIVIFSPLAIASLNSLEYSDLQQTFPSEIEDGKTCHELKQICEEQNVIGILLSNVLLAGHVDFEFSQSMIMKMAAIFPPLFPKPLPGMRECYHSPSSSSSSLLRSGSLYQAIPMEIICPITLVDHDQPLTSTSNDNNNDNDNNNNREEQQERDCVRISFRSYKDYLLRDYEKYKKVVDQNTTTTMTTNTSSITPPNPHHDNHHRPSHLSPCQSSAPPSYMTIPSLLSDTTNSSSMVDSPSPSPSLPKSPNLRGSSTNIFSKLNTKRSFRTSCGITSLPSFNNNNNSSNSSNSNNPVDLARGLSEDNSVATMQSDVLLPLPIPLPPPSSSSKREFVTEAEDDDDDSTSPVAMRMITKQGSTDLSIPLKTARMTSSLSRYDDPSCYPSILPEETTVMTITRSESPPLPPLISQVELVQVPPPNPFHDILEVTFLGTGCATPSKYRNNSGILLHFLSNGARGLKENGSMNIISPNNKSNKSSSTTSSTSNLVSNVQNELLGNDQLTLLQELNTTNNNRIIVQDNRKTNRLTIDTNFHCYPQQPQQQQQQCSSDGNEIDIDQSPQKDVDSKSSQVNLDNVIAVDEDLPPDCYVLLDCGESIVSQLFQSVQGNLQRLDDILLKIRVIWISHHHADHCTGLPNLLQHIYTAQLRQKHQNNTSTSTTGNSNVDHNESSSASSSSSAGHRIPARCTPPSFYNKYMQRQYSDSIIYEDDKILLIGSENVLKYYEFVINLSGLDELVSLYPITNTLYAGCTRPILQASHGLIKRLVSIPVQHCASAFGIVLDTISGYRIVYSGDCRPSQSLVKNGLYCDLLIHEATFNEDRCEDAIKKKHTTLLEAIDIANRMQAKHTILTHFSQRYPLSDGHGHGSWINNHHVTLAYDFMHFSFPSQALVLPKVSRDIATILKLYEDSGYDNSGEQDENEEVEQLATRSNEILSVASNDS